MRTQVFGGLLAPPSHQQIQQLKVFLALLDDARPVKHGAILDKTPKPIDSFDGVEKEGIAATTDDGLVEFRSRLEELGREASQISPSRIAIC
jgi:hypothetical protein